MGAEEDRAVRMTREVCSVSEKIDVDTGKVAAGVACISNTRLKGLALYWQIGTTVSQGTSRNYLDGVLFA